MTLVGWWPLTETSGDAQDYSSNGNTGTVNGATQGATGVVGYNAYSFDGVNDTVDISTNVFPSETLITITGWGKLSSGASPGSNDYDLFTRGDVPKLWVRNGSVSAIIDDGSSTHSLFGPTASTGIWYHWALVLSSSSSTLYVDGIKEDSTNNASTDGDSVIPTRIGADDDDTRFWDGNIFDVRVYDRVLSPQEILYIYEAAQSGRVRFSSKTDS